tara:strand:+ start:361 stop:567 length:207 start_codon:yes stop_codon:yes gene_type:complete
MKVGDLVAYAWNEKERPEEVELAIVMDPCVSWPSDGHYVEICLQAEPSLSPPLRVPAFKLSVIGEHNE